MSNVFLVVSFNTNQESKQQIFDIQNSKFDTSKSMSCRGLIAHTSALGMTNCVISKADIWANNERKVS